MTPKVPHGRIALIVPTTRLAGHAGPRAYQSSLELAYHAARHLPMDWPVDRGALSWLRELPRPHRHGRGGIWATFAITSRRSSTPMSKRRPADLGNARSVFAQHQSAPRLSAVYVAGGGADGVVPLDGAPRRRWIGPERPESIRTRSGRPWPRLTRGSVPKRPSRNSMPCWLPGRSSRRTTGPLTTPSRAWVRSSSSRIRTPITSSCASGPRPAPHALRKRSIRLQQLACQQ
jgi:hypothetical protein